MDDNDYKGNGPNKSPDDGGTRSGGTGGNSGGSGGSASGQSPIPKLIGTTDPPSTTGSHGRAVAPSPGPKSPFSGGKTPPPTKPEPVETGTLPPYVGEGKSLPLWPPKPARPPVPAGRTDTFIPTTEPLPFIYGAVRCGGQVVYQKVQADGSMLVVWRICWGPINSISNIQLDGKPVATWNVTTHVYTGTRTQTVDSFMAAAEPNWTSGYPGMAYVVGKIPKPGPGGQPTPDVRTVTFDVQGMLVRDPRSDATLSQRFYRDNPALCLADFESNINFGRGRELSRMDWSGSITTSANDCDAIIDGVSLKRFTIGLWGGDQKDSDQWITDLRAHAQLVVVENSGLWQVWMDKSQAAAAVVITDSGANANIVSTGPLQISGAKRVWTRVRVNFTNAANGYKDDFAEDVDPRVAIGTVPDVLQQVDLRGITTYDQARRIARYLRKKSQLATTVQLRLLQDGGVQLLPGVRVPVTCARHGWVSKDVLVTDCAPVTWTSGGQPFTGWDVVVELYDATIYDDSQISTTSVAPPIQLYGATFWNQTQLGAAATVNGRVLTGKTSHIVFDIATSDTVITLDDNVFAVGDRLYLENSPVGVNQTEYMAVTAGPTGTGPYTYTVTRDLATTGAKAWRAGDMLFSTGQTGDGFIDLYGTRGVKSSSEVGPTIVGNVRVSNTYNDWQPRWAIGNLNGLYGYGVTTYGCAFGVPTGAWVKIDPTNGVRIGFNVTTKVQIDAAGNASFAGSITADSGTIGGWTITSSELVGPAGVAIRSGQTAYNSGTGFFLGNVGGTPKFSIGNSGGNRLTWDGSDLTIIGLKADQIIAAIATVTITANDGTSLTVSNGSLISGNAGTTFTATGGGDFNTISGSYKQNGTKVVGARGAAVADATNATDVITQLNALLARLRAATGHGLIA
jgi:hypothetical protein